MRTLFFLVFACFFVQSALPQPSKSSAKSVKPSQKQIQEQLQQVRGDATAEITKIENEIAEAKAKNEDPETIKAMETQLATMKKMIGVVDRASSMQEKRLKNFSTENRNIPKDKSPFVPIPLKSPVRTPSDAEAKDQLFWYIGKKVDAATLVTTEGIVVRYDRQNSQLIIQPEKRDTLYYGLVKTLEQTSRMKSDFVANMDGIKNIFFMFPNVFAAYRESDYMKEMYYDMAKNTIPLPPVPIQYLDPDLEKMHNHLISMRDELIQMMASLPPITGQSLLPAPERPHGLCLCDSVPRLAYENRLPNWVWEFYGDETKLSSKIIDMSNQREEFQRRGGGSIPNWNATIFKATSLMIKRESEKLLLMVENYETEKNIYKEGALAGAAIGLKLDLSVFQPILDDDESIKAQAEFRVRRAKDLIFKNLFKDYIEGQKGRENYDVVLDYALYRSHELIKKLFQPTHDVEKKVAGWVAQSEKFNRFTINLSIDFELNYVNVNDNDDVLMTADGFLKSDPVIVSLGQRKCKWQFVKTNVDHTDMNATDEEFHIPMKVMQGKKDYLKDDAGPYYYSKPEYMQMVFPSFRISFCRDGSGGEIPDSVYLKPLRYGDADLEAYKRINNGRAYTTDMYDYVNKALIGIKKTQINAEKVVDVAGKMIDMSGIPDMPSSSSTGDPRLDKMKMEYIGNEQKEDLQDELIDPTHTANTGILFNAANGTHVLTVLTHDTTEAGDMDKENGIKFLRGKVILRVNHTPQ